MRTTQRLTPPPLGSPPAEMLLSNTMDGRHDMIVGPSQLAAHIAVETAAKRSHDANEKLWHANRPALRTCPYDNACRYV